MTSITDYWPRDEQYCTPFYSNVMACDRFIHILRFLHFENNDDPDYDRLWKIRKISDTLNNTFCELYNPTEHLAVDEVIMLYKGRAVFRQYIPKKHKRFGIKNLQTLRLSGLHLWYARVFRQTKTTCHSSNNSKTWNGAASYLKSWRTGPQNLMDNYFTSPALFDDLFQWKINACGIVSWREWNATIYWAKISKNEKRGHSDTSQGNPKSCLMERQAGCTHSDKHARSRCWRKFHQRIRPGYQTSCCRRLQCIHGVCGQVRQIGQQLWNCPQNLEVD